MLGDRLEYTDSLVRHLWACVTMLAGVGFEDGRCTDTVSGQDGDFVSMGHQLGTIMCVAAYVLLVILSYQTFRLTSKRKKKHIKCSGVSASELWNGLRSIWRVIRVPPSLINLTLLKLMTLFQLPHPQRLRDQGLTSLAIQGGDHSDSMKRENETQRG